jgi:hypothetical protein
MINLRNKLKFLSLPTEMFNILYIGTKGMMLGDLILNPELVNTSSMTRRQSASPAMPQQTPF